MTFMLLLLDNAIFKSKVWNTKPLKVYTREGKKRSKRQRRMGTIYQSEYRVPKNSKERQESLLKWIIQRNRGKQ